ncbi:MAG: 50S ribosomal protein L25 [Anaerolineae bacterium]|nr:50S ribosomal protein L25 [Thermoflexales bacterium]MDW8406794.1 50S ribosomal protein L25 [Anaerolineae bacterium]
MSENITLNADVRTAVGSGVGALRRAGLVPGIVYGRHVQPVCIQVQAKELAAVLRAAGRNRLISLKVGGEEKMVLTREIQRDPIRGAIKHVDFYQVSLTEKINADVLIEPVGESADVKSGVGVLLQEMNSLSIRCLPADLIERITVDVSNLKVDDSIYVRDLAIPAGIEVMDEPDAVVFRVTRFVEEKVEETPVEAGEVEVIEKGKKEEQEEGEE